jgi:hypothetical protein
VGLNQNWKVHLLGEPAPPLDYRNAVLQATRSNIRLEINVVDPELGCRFKDRIQVINGFGKTLTFGAKPAHVEKPTKSFHRSPVAVPGANSVETGLCNHLNILVQASFDPVRMTAFHCP